MGIGKDTFSLALAGDAIINRRINDSGNTQLEALLETIRETDAAAVNLETLLHDFEGYPSATAPGTPMCSPPWVADELTAAGFNLFTFANNHTGDYSHGGMLATMRELENRNIPYSGVGENLAEARAPAYVDTPAGRVALVSACTSVPTGSDAGPQSPILQGRPGLAPLHLETTYTLPEDDLEALVALSDRLGLEEIKERRMQLGFPPFSKPDDEFRFMVVGADTQPKFEVGSEYAVKQIPDPKDVDALLNQIEAADRQADWVLTTLHSHEGASGRRNDHSVPQFLRDFAHDCIEAGSDAFFGHGPHVLRGIEIYNETPIFYSLGNFIFQLEMLTRIDAETYGKYDLSPNSNPADYYDRYVLDNEGNPRGFLTSSAFWEGVLPVCHYSGRSIQRIDLYPLDLGFENDRPDRGFPLLAEGKKADSIISQVAKLSNPYETDIEQDGNLGRISL